MVIVAWAGRQSVRQDRRSGVSDRAFQRDVHQVQPIGQGTLGVAHVYREQPTLDTKLWAAVSEWRGYSHGLCRVDRKSSHKQTLLQKTTDAVVQIRCAFVAADASESAR